VTPADEDACRVTARHIEQQRPGWMITWGVYTKTFVAFPLFPVRRQRTIVTAVTPMPCWHGWKRLSAGGGCTRRTRVNRANWLDGAR
jgi:hypothetical protein